MHVQHALLRILQDVDDIEWFGDRDESMKIKQELIAKDCKSPSFAASPAWYDLETGLFK